MAAHPKHDAVRGRYHGCCGYCGVREEDAGGEFTIDHFVPIADGGDDQDDNLVYCCFRCNLYKSAFSPTDRDCAAGHVVLHPLRDDPTLHMQLNASSGLLDALTASDLLGEVAAALVVGG